MNTGESTHDGFFSKGSLMITRRGLPAWTILPGEYDGEVLVLRAAADEFVVELPRGSLAVGTVLDIAQHRARYQRTVHPVTHPSPPTSPKQQSSPTRAPAAYVSRALSGTLRIDGCDGRTATGAIELTARALKADTLKTGDFSTSILFTAHHRA